MEDTCLRNIIIKAHGDDVSDIYIQTDNPVFFRSGGQMYKTGITPGKSEMDEILSIMFKDPGIIAAMYDKEERDLSYAMTEGSLAHRFRVNVCLTKQGVGIVMRRLKTVDPQPEKFGVPAELIEMVNSTKNGIVFIAGVTGSGKSTTLAALIGSLARKHCLNIVTIEDPIEYEIPRGRSNVMQREVGTLTKSFDQALRAAMREKPDIIMVGEVRDPDTVLAAIKAAETGHLVLTTVHTHMASQVPSRLAAMFPVDKQAWILSGMAATTIGCMTQVLVPSSIDRTLVLATEFMDTRTVEARRAIAGGDGHTLRNLMRKAAKTGTVREGWTLNNDLFRLVMAGRLDARDGLMYSNDAVNFRRE